LAQRIYQFAIHSDYAFSFSASPLSAHSATRIEVFAPPVGGFGEDWRLTVPLFRPRWQQKIGAVLDRVGLHLAIFSAKKVYPSTTNILAKPSELPGAGPEI